MNSYRDLITQALELKVQIDDLRSATYTVVNFEEESGPAYMFIASFDLESMHYTYAIADANWIEVKILSQLKPETIAAFGEFVSNMIEFTKGGPHPYNDSIVANNPESVRSPFEVAKPTHAFIDDSNVGDDEASLK